MSGKKDAQTIDKPAMEFLIGEFILEMGDILRYGEKRYGAENWKEYPLGVKDYKGARLRHAFKEGIDKDTGYSHLAHEAVNCMMQWWHERNRPIGSPFKLVLKMNNTDINYCQYCEFIKNETNGFIKTCLYHNIQKK